MVEKKLTDWFKEDPDQPRKQFDEEEDRRLGQSMLAHGQLQPVRARSNGIVLVGARRVRAAKLVGIKELEVVISDQEFSNSEVRMRQVAENVHRSDLTGWEKFVAYHEIITLNPGWQQKDLADHLKLNEGTVSRALSVAKCSQEWQDALKAGQVTLTQCARASQMKPDEQEGFLASILTGLEKQQKRGRKKCDPAPAKAKKLNIPLPSGAVVTVTGDDLSLEDVAEVLAEAIKATKHGIRLGYKAKTFVSTMKDNAGN
jgi:ParB/RepB/Spo0J family partition protein